MLLTGFVFLLLWSFAIASIRTTTMSGKVAKGGGRHEIFFKNITQILDHLLKDYDSSQHPNYKHVTLPNKLLRISQEGEITYSMRLTIKAKCPMCLKNFPLDEQSCPLIIGSYAYNSRHLVYIWDKSGESVSFVPGMTLSQFDLISYPYKSLNITTNDGEFSVLQVNFNLSRNLGNFVIQVYVPCTLIVILSWVSFWINREATSDRVGLGITAFLTLSTISIDSRTDLPKVHYATALDVFLIMSFAYCMASLLEFAGVHYFTKIGSGEKMIEEDDDAWTEAEPEPDDALTEWTSGGAICQRVQDNQVYNNEQDDHFAWNHPVEILTPSKSMETKETQTERRASCFRQFLRCVVADQAFRRERQRAAALESSTNSVSKIDKVSRVLFPFSFLLLNILYWIMYAYSHSACERKN